MRQIPLSGRRHAPALAILAVLSLGSALAGCLFGPLRLDPATVLHVVWARLSGDAADPALSTIVVDIRLARSCLAWLTGAALAVAGAVFQGILRNPLADPFTIGVSTGAAFGASLAIAAGAAGLGGALGMGLLPVAAMAGALAALAAVLLLGRAGGRLRRETVVLAGIVVATFLSALISLLKSLDEESLSSIVFWVMGSFQGRTWTHATFLLPYLLAGLAAVVLYSRELDILSLGDDQARMVGVDADRARLVLLVAASLITGAAVSVAGVIGFVGLVAPHLVRLVVGAEHRPLLAYAGLVGGAALVWSDVLARVLLPEGQELPVGVITALAGGPFFCLLLRRKARGEEP